MLHCSPWRGDWLILWNTWITGETEIHVLPTGMAFFATIKLAPMDISMSERCKFHSYSRSSILYTIRPYVLVCRNSYLLWFSAMYSTCIHSKCVPVFYTIVLTTLSVNIMQSTAYYESVWNFSTWGWKLISSWDTVSLYSS